MAHYNLMTLDVLEMFRMKELLREGESISIDFTHPIIRSKILSHTDRHEDNAMFWQLLSCLSGNSEDFQRVRGDADALGKTILYLDFKGIFGIFSNAGADTTPEDRFCRDLVENGFTVSYSASDRRHYVVFDRSGSMSRTCRTSFVDDTVFPQIEERVRLGMPWDRTEVGLSKFYSYRGLLFSDGMRISDPLLILNEKTVIVIPDDSHLIRTEVLKVKTELNRNGEVAIESSQVTDNTTETNAFDGEGLIAPACADIINDVRRRTGKGARPATSFQIRLPFAKGMLHSVDFCAFVQEICGDFMPAREASVTDVFGIARRLDEAQIILTASMFKCRVWLQDICRSLSITDPMQYYFSQLHKYDHALYLLRTDRDYVSDDQIPLNYQLINTIAMDGKQIDKIVERHLKNAHDPLRFAWEASRGYVRETEDEVYVEEQAVRDGGFPLWVTALRINPEFRRDPYIRRLLNAEQTARIRDVAAGRIRVKGKNRILSGDLLAFMIHLIRYTDRPGQTEAYKERFEKQKEKRIRELIGKTLRGEWFFDVGYQESGLKHGYRYGMLRNPHLSRNEQCAQRAYVPKNEEDLYSRFFSHLSGVLMLAYDSTAAMAMGGADYDGDIIKLVLSKTVNSAILRAYERIEMPDTDKVSYRRKYPVIQIPSQGKVKERVPLRTGYELLRRTFAGRVGQISNLAVRIGAIAYLTEDEEMQKDCALCTILTGLEIDAAKNGARPDIESMRKKYRQLSDDRTDYIKLSKILTDEKYLPGRRSITLQEKNNTRSEYVISRGKTKIHYVHYVPDEKVSNINRLCGYVIRDICDERKRTPKSERTEAALFRFQLSDTFEPDPNWKERIGRQKDAEEKQKQIAALAGAYVALRKRSQIQRAQRENVNKSNNYLNRIYTRLLMQYDRGRELLPYCKESIDDAILTARSELIELLPNGHAVDESLKRLQESGWAFAGKQTKASELNEVLGTVQGDAKLSEETKEILMNDFADGFDLLYFYLKDLSAAYKEMPLPEEEMEDEGVSEIYGAEISDEYQYHSLLKREYLQRERLNADKRVFKDTLQKACVDILRDRMGYGDDLSEALAYYYAMRKSVDPEEYFLWEVFPPKTIIENIVAAEYVKEKETEHAE